jgi:hypothetical protein
MFHPLFRLEWIIFIRAPARRSSAILDGWFSGAPALTSPFSKGYFVLGASVLDFPMPRSLTSGLRLV